jgi:hypothetical protein
LFAKPPAIVAMIMASGILDRGIPGSRIHACTLLDLGSWMDPGSSVPGFWEYYKKIRKKKDIEKQLAHEYILLKIRPTEEETNNTRSPKTARASHNIIMQNITCTWSS